MRKNKFCYHRRQKSLRYENYSVTIHLEAVPAVRTCPGQTALLPQPQPQYRSPRSQTRKFSFSSLQNPALLKQRAERVLLKQFLDPAPLHSLPYVLSFSRTSHKIQHHHPILLRNFYNTCRTPLYARLSMFSVVIENSHITVGNTRILCHGHLPLAGLAGLQALTAHSIGPVRINDLSRS